MGSEEYRTPTHMSAVQKLATARNGRAEILVDFILHRFAAELFEGGHLTQFRRPVLQKVFARDDCRDRFDHFLELDRARPIGSAAGTLQVWDRPHVTRGTRAVLSDNSKGLFN